ncbi:hypothetical protein BJI67_15930 (plasmid) [Acidihalobacter aeolianus]|uniref:Uncharacterized protein n=2 Tax=Acidihalobacter aeolianus TaxID=2792603 RepID=A0A1D8KCQ0_9GAMM|nr:hypothetical protein BJI67_15930 [Acidihalobacter aeolianus]
MAASLIVAGSAQAAGGLTTYYGVGGGIGTLDMSGSYIQSRRVPFLQVGWDGTGHGAFVVLQSGFATDNSAAYINTLIGFGWSWLKFGGGFWQITATTPTRGGLNLAPSLAAYGIQVVTDGSRHTRMTNQAFPVYVRITPWHDHNNILTLNVWRSLHNLGRESIPVTLLGGTGSFNTKWDGEGQIEGGSIRYTHRLTQHLGINVDYLYMEGRNAHGVLPVAYGPSVAAPVVRWQTRVLVLSAQLVF